MKNLFLILLIPALIVACEAPDKSSQLEKLKADRQKIDKQIADLEAELGDSLTTKSEKVKYVEVKEVNPSKFEHFIEVQGAVDTDQNVMITSQSAGTIERVYVREGDKVKKGQTLFTLDAQILKNSMAEVQTSLDFAKDMFEKQKQLWEQKIGSEVQYLTAKNQKECLERRLATLNEQMDLMRVTSPIDGVVDNLAAKSGELTSPGMPLGRVVNLSDFEIKANVAENYSSNVKNGTPVKLWFPDLKAEMDAEVAYTGNIIDPINRTFNIVIRFSNPEVSIKPNMVCVVKIIDYSAEEALVVPVNSIQKTDLGQYIFVAKEENGRYIADRRKISSEMEYNGAVLVSEGLSPNDKLITFGYQDLTQGQVVEF